MISKIKKIIGLVSEKNIPKREGEFFEMTVDMSETNDVRSMHIGSPTIQSSMRISDPYHLELDYTQIMALAAIFLEKPKDLLFVGLGGAAIQKFFYRWFSKSNIVTIEINLSAISVAKQFFKIPLNSKRFKIIQDDGIDYIKNAKEKYDLILSDAFEEYGLPEVFCEIPYFEDCKDRLTEHGIFTINLWGSDPRTSAYIDRIKLIFEDRVLHLKSTSSGNIIVFAFNSLPNENRIDLLKRKILTMEKQIDFELMVYFNKILKNQKNKTNYLFLS